MKEKKRKKPRILNLKKKLLFNLIIYLQKLYFLYNIKSYYLIIIVSNLISDFKCNNCFYTSYIVMLKI